MYPNNQHAATMAPPAPIPQSSRSVDAETFLLDQEAQQTLPQDAVVALQQVDNLKYFLISAPVDWSQDQYIRRFLLPTGEYVSCVLWNNLFHISGTDIVRCLAFRFQAFGRPVKNSKKFEEGIFSDLRNLKSGTDASLEEPKSPFLDFLYKNNCIRTQKKQKVFYWFSVQHDRLFLDALERDLKREAQGGEPTTVATSEPALSFEFDSTQTLFEQLTKAQQSNQSAFNFPPSSLPTSDPTSPVMRAADSMPPPSIIPHQPAPHQMSHTPTPQPMMSNHGMPPVLHDDALIQIPTFTQMGMPLMPSQIRKTREQSVNPVFDRNGVPLTQIAHRHSSMPAYMEYSPAPSFISSHFEDYSQRGLSYEPMTPPHHHSFTMGAEPAYIANEDTGLYTAIPDAGMQQAWNPLTSVPLNLATGQQQHLHHSSSMPRTHPSQQIYSVADGSPNYKQRRRQSSITQHSGVAAVAAANSIAAHAVHRPSDLRRSMSSSVVEQVIPEHRSMSYVDSPLSMQPTYPPTSQPTHEPKDLHDLSQRSTPFHSIDTAEPQPYQQPPTAPAQESFPSFAVSHSIHHPALHRTSATSTGVIRRARSATISEMDPYPNKSFSCPITSCARLFKRIEHLKRHMRTHTQEKPYKCPLCGKAFSRSDNLAQHRRTHEASGISGEVVGEEEDEEVGDVGDELLAEVEELEEGAFPGVRMETAGEMVGGGSAGGGGNAHLIAVVGGYAQ